jgi:anti-sigma regulatory factor (Ser/Thr protein kinase)
MITTSAQRGEPDEPALEIELEANPHAPAIARAAVNGFADRLELDRTTLATLALLVSEIVTNAVVHPDAEEGGKIALRALLSSGTLRVEVIDQGTGFTPAARDPAQIAGGYGLFLLDKQAARWGVERCRGTSVWFELAA